jgi:hypothetical protein
MDPTQFANVNPAAFQFAQAPGSFLGRSFTPQLPAVGGYSRADLERMRFALMQSGGDPGKLQRIMEVMAMRRADAGDPPVMLRPTPAKARRVAARAPQAMSYNPFAAVEGVLGQPVQ